MKMRLKKVISMLLMAAVIATLGEVISDNKAEAAVVYIKVDAYAESIANAIGLKPVSGPQQSQYVNVLIEKEIIKEGDFSSYTAYLTRTDAAVILNRADEFLYGDTLDADLVNLALEKRISDIESIQESKRIDVVKCYLKGMIKGYSNGNYSTDRAMKGSNKISKTGALGCIKMLKDKSLRAKISPDGQLIRTSKLPVYAKKYPYILASYPNEYYDWKFEYEWHTRTVNGKPVEYVNLVDYASPVDVDKVTFHGDFKVMKEKRLDIWVNEAKIFLENLLNVDYRTIDKDWIDMIIKTNDAYTYNESMMRDYLEEYLSKMEKNKTIVECASVDIDGASLYYYNMTYYLRAHVKYRVVSSFIPLEMDTDTLNESWAHNDILFSQYFVDLMGCTLGKWRDGYYEVSLANYSDGISGSMVRFDDAQYLAKKVSK